MEEILMNNDLDIIYSRMEKLFKRISRTRYWILVNNDPYDQSYNFFFNSQRQGERLKSVPLHKLINYDLSYLEQVIKGLRSKTKPDNRVYRFCRYEVAFYPKSHSMEA
ncbi:hypothetical protein HMPREF0519_1685 [Lentilactobacillus hilgardii DSM 20176 = ATCC 8290]|uniref:Uncharacterized protein n=1 Tax=Lentilactobacillus hilgardii (strain ATCC 8290 / DSM 20176 / CCUG 30140 / JCM 1155 / KCTC 3500 / NBRC 15886 / NCIMB 8040 / NRRL B-1843 / 9) TaxID=1423757 RepID=C0XKC4_LENH9|nr:hypothetical protein HMPREF0519_1685 [Lentilactobacillus hilgardii DSM 20176 = ATCC 8290]